MKTHRLSLILRLAVLIAVFAVLGCASDDYSELKLQNVLDAKAEKQALLKAEEKEAALASQLLEERASQKKLKLEALQSLVDQSTQNPEELALLLLPAHIKRIRHTPLVESEIQNMATRLMPDATALWSKKGSAVIMLAGSAGMKGKDFSKLTKEAFSEELRAIGKLSTEYYSAFQEASAEFQIDEVGKVLVLRIKSRFRVNKVSQKHVRYFYYFRPDYRINFLIAGEASDVSATVKEIEGDLEDFETKLATLYTEGISFK